MATKQPFGLTPIAVIQHLTTGGWVDALVTTYDQPERAEEAFERLSGGTGGWRLLALSPTDGEMIETVVIA